MLHATCGFFFQPKIISLSPIKVHVRSNATLDSKNIRIVDAFYFSGPIEIKILQSPTFGRLALKSRYRDAINKFTYEQLNLGEISYISTVKADSDYFQVVACVGEICSSTTTIKVLLEKDNIYPPEIIKNEPLVLINTNSAKLTDNVLNIQVSQTLYFFC